MPTFHDFICNYVSFCHTLYSFLFRLATCYVVYRLNLFSFDTKKGSVPIKKNTS